MTDSMIGNDGSWWIIILFLFLFAGNGFNGMGNGNNVLQSDFATIQRQLSDGTNTIERKLDNQNAGLCDLGYTQAQLINNVRYDALQNVGTLQNAINSGFCTTNYNVQNTTRDIVEASNANTRAILDAIQTNKVEALQSRISEQNEKIASLQLAASQQAQNAYLINQLAPKVPVASYTVPNPFTGCGYCG